MDSSASSSKFIFNFIVAFAFILLAGGLAIFFVTYSQNFIKNLTTKSIQSQQSAELSGASCEIQKSLIQAKACAFVIGNDSTTHGTGFVINKEGYAITNLHVINTYNSGLFEIRMNGMLQEARVVAISENEDLSLIKIEPTNDFCTLFDSDALGLAEEVYAIGWPNSSEGESTVTKGIVSRKIINSDNNVEMIQTDTAINPGNSGGPLVSKCGVVGINTSKIFGSIDKPAEGIGYSITSKVLKNFIDKSITQDTGFPIKVPTPKPIPVSKQTSTEIPGQGSSFDYQINKKVSYDYEQVKYWEKIRQQDKEILASWKKALGNQYADQDDVAELLDSLERQIELSNFLWDGYTNSKITYKQAQEASIEYSKINSKAVALSLRLSKDMKQNAYEDCVEQYEDLEDSTGDDYDDEKDECKEILK